MSNFLYNYAMYDRYTPLRDLINFRSLMGLPVSKSEVKRIWGKKYYREIPSDIVLGDTRNDIQDIKLDICNANLHNLLVFNWVKFIGISGSVAAGFCREEDDIDVFIVVRNDVAWLYRGILSIMNLFHKKIRVKWRSDIKDKFCINFICEERGLCFDNDIFNFHELMYLIPVYNEKYLNFIYSQNLWLREEHRIKLENITTRERISEKKIFLLPLLNRIAFYLQLGFMKIFGHSPNISRLRNNYRLGRVEFFPGNYKGRIINHYNKVFKSIS